MNKVEAVAIVIETLRSVSSFDLGDKITEEMHLHNDLGLESYDGILITPTLAKKFNVVIPNEVNPIVDDKKRTFRTIGEIATFMLDMHSTKLEKTHAQK